MTRPTVPGELAFFCEREYPRLVGALALYCGDLDVAEELAQEALARACRDWPRLATMAAPGAWVHRVGINLSNSSFRRAAARRRAQRRLSAGTPTEHRDADPGDAVAVRQALAALPTRKRTAVVLRYYLGHSVAETAELMGVPQGTVKSLVARAMVDLRAGLRGCATERGVR